MLEVVSVLFVFIGCVQISNIILSFEQHSPTRFIFGFDMDSLFCKNYFIADRVSGSNDICSSLYLHNVSSSTFS